MVTEEDFQRLLNQNIEDYTTRLVFADWLEEQGDERAEGYRALGLLRLWPFEYVQISDITKWVFGTKDNTSYIVIYKHSMLDPRWFNTTTNGYSRWWTYHYSRQAGENRVALGYSKLPSLVKADILSSVP